MAAIIGASIGSELACNFSSNNKPSFPENEKRTEEQGCSTSVISVLKPSPVHKPSPKELFKEKCVNDYKALCNAVEQNNLIETRSLLQNNATLATFCHTDTGTPLHFVKSLAMAQLLANDFGLNPNACDEFGDTASQSIKATRTRWFITPGEKLAIIDFLQNKEKSAPFNRLWNQCKGNKFVQAPLALTVAVIIYIGRWIIFCKNVPPTQALLSTPTA